MWYSKQVYRSPVKISGDIKNEDAGTNSGSERRMEMKQTKQKLLGLILTAVLTLGIVLVPVKGSEASGIYKYGSFAVTALSSTQVTIDYRNIYSGLSGATVYGYKISVEDVTMGTGEVLIRQAAANEVYGTITGLTPGHTYSVIVRTSYQYIGSDVGELYDFVQFDTPLSGVAADLDVVTDTTVVVPGTEQSTTQQPQASGTPAAVSVAAPSISAVKMVADNVTAAVTPVACSGYEFGIFNQKTNRLVKSETTTLANTTFYGLSRKNVYLVRARAYTYDTAGNRVYSAWGAGKYFVPQPQIRRTATKVKKNSILLKWSKVTGAKNYTIYMRKRSSGKWYKVKTVSSKKSSYKITRFRGKRFNTHRQDYEVRIKASAKIGGKTYNSTTNNYIYTYTTYR